MGKNAFGVRIVNITKPDFLVGVARIINEDSDEQNGSNESEQPKESESAQPAEQPETDEQPDTNE